MPVLDSPLHGMPSRSPLSFSEAENDNGRLWNDQESPVRSQTDAKPSSRVIVLQDLTLDGDTINLAFQSGLREHVAPQEPIIESPALPGTPQSSLNDVIVSAAIPETVSPPAEIEAELKQDPTGDIHVHFAQLLLEAQERRDAAIREAEYAYEQELRALVGAKESMLAEELARTAAEVECGPSVEATTGPIPSGQDEEVEDPLCGLCYDALRTKGRVVLLNDAPWSQLTLSVFSPVLKPCNHSLCRFCLDRLRVDTDVHAIRCPWDRFDVTVEDL